jgi:hypothetical protein
MELVIKGVLSAAVVACLLWLAQRWSSRVAGMLTGLPVVSAPAMLWLAAEHGPAYAEEVCAGAVVAGAACALFALCYAMAVRHLAIGATLAVGTLGAAVPLLVAAMTSSDLPIGLGLQLLLATAVCVFCLSALSWAMGRSSPACLPGGLAHASATAARSVTWTPPRAFWWRGRVSTAWMTPVTAGLISIVTGALAGQLGAFWSGLLSSMPWVCAAVAMQLHRQASHVAVMSFLHGYTAGLIGRCAFVAVVAANAQAWGLTLALLVAAAAATATALCTARGWPLQHSHTRDRRLTDVQPSRGAAAANGPADWRPQP